MKICDIKAIQNGKVKKDGVTVPVLKLVVIPGPDSFPDLLRFTYNITNMTTTTMTLKLLFENPVEVSTDDLLKIKFNDIKYL